MTQETIRVITFTIIGGIFHLRVDERFDTNGAFLCVEHCVALSIVVVVFVLVYRFS